MLGDSLAGMKQHTMEFALFSFQTIFINGYNSSFLHTILSIYGIIYCTLEYNVTFENYMKLISYSSLKILFLIVFQIGIAVN